MSTLDIKRPSGQTPALALLILTMLLSIGEVTVRQQRFQAFLTVPNLGTRHQHLDWQWHRLEILTKSVVQIQCIALGNSMVLNGFDPHLFSQSFFEQTGQEMRCFNFGIDALTPVAANALAQILVETYHPRLLIFGTDARDYAVPQDAEETTVITEMAWLQFRLGDFNFRGWLVDHSYLYRYRHSLVNFMNLYFNQKKEPVTNQYGFEPFDNTFPVTTPPDPNDNFYQVQYYYRILDSYTIRPENQQAITHMLARQNVDTTIVVMEMPVPDTYFYFFDNPATDYNRFIDTLRTITGDYNVLLLETTHLQLIPDDGWADYSHMNNKGAIIFSEWLGKQLGEAVLDGQISVFHP